MKGVVKPSMAEVVLDTSVLLAAIRKEIGIESILPVLEGAIMSAVNWCELHTKLEDFGLREAVQTSMLLQLIGRIETFSETQAAAAASLRGSTRAAGLSLGGRACIALALELNADVYTADRAWVTVDLPCRIYLIR